MLRFLRRGQRWLTALVVVGVGGVFAVFTAQKRQPRVQVSPRIKNVAVLLSQHSLIFGQRASSHTVCKFFSRIRRLSRR